MIGIDTNLLVRYLIGAICKQAGCEKTATFDRKLETESGFELMQ